MLSPEVFGQPLLILTDHSIRSREGTRCCSFNLRPTRPLIRGPSPPPTTFFLPQGDTPSISSLGNINGIVWVQENHNGQVGLHAYEATNLANQLYSSANVNFAAPTKFAPPSVCDGKVMVGIMNSVAVIGLLILQISMVMGNKIFCGEAFHRAIGYLANEWLRGSNKCCHRNCGFLLADDQYRGSRWGQ